MRYAGLLAWATALAVSGQPTAATHYVSMEGSNEAPYLTPDSAATAIPLAMAAAEPGDTVFVSAGFWAQELVVVPYGVTLRGEGPGLTFLDLADWSDDNSTVAPEDGSVLEALSIGDTGSFSLWGIGSAMIKRCYLGAVELLGENAPVFEECLFYAYLSSRDGNPVFARCTLFGEIRCYERSRPLFDRCRFINTDSVRCEGTSFTTLLGCEGLHVSAYQGGTAFVVGSPRCSGSASHGGDLTIRQSDVQWVSCQADSHILLENCVVQRHRSPALYLDSGATMDLLGCTVGGNEIAVVFQGNTPPMSLSIQNTILAGNQVDFAGTTDVVHCSYSLLPPELVGTGPGNITGDPEFVDAERGDFRLRADSPCIDAGFNHSDLPEFDIAGMRRIMFGGKSLTVDMGAYEFYINKLELLPGTDEAVFTWSSLADKTYSIFYTDDLFNWHTAIANFPSLGNQTTSWLDDGALTGLPPLLAPKRFYRVLENP
jgi:hypothetical protein